MGVFYFGLLILLLTSIFERNINCSEKKQQNQMLPFEKLNYIFIYKTGSHPYLTSGLQVRYCNFRYHQKHCFMLRQTVTSFSAFNVVYLLRCFGCVVSLRSRYNFNSECSGSHIFLACFRT